MPAPPTFPLPTTPSRAISTTPTQMPAAAPPATLPPASQLPTSQPPTCPSPATQPPAPQPPAPQPPAPPGRPPAAARARALAALLLLLAPAPLSAQTQTPADPLDFLHQGRFADALALTTQLLHTHPDDGQLWLDRGLAENGLRRTADAEQSLRHALTVRPDLLPAAQAGAQIAYTAHTPQAPAFLADVLRLDPASAPAHAMLGVLALEAHHCPEALDHFRHAPELAQADPATERRLARCSAETGDPETAARTLTRLHAATPTDPDLTLELAAADLQAHHPDATIALLEPSAATLPAPALNLLAAAYAAAGNLPAAIETYRTAIAHAPADETSYLDLATLSMDHQSPDVALSVLDTGLRANSRATRLLVMRGSVYAQLGKDDLAQRDFEQATRLDPNSTFGTLGMGVLLREQSNLDQAQTILEQKLAANATSSPEATSSREATSRRAATNSREFTNSKDDPVLCFMLADVLIRKGADPGDPAFARAEDLLHRAIAQQPRFAPAHAALGKLELKQGHAAQAATELETAITLEPTDRTALNQLIAAYRQLGRTGDAARISAQLTRSVAAERAQETEKNRIHLTVADPGATPAAAPATTPDTSAKQP